MAAITTECMARIHSLDMRYQESLHKEALVNGEEDIRRASLRMLSLQDHNIELQWDLSEKLSSIELFTTTTSELRQELSDAKTFTRDQEFELKKNRLELRSLEAEVQTLRSSNCESDGAVKEKAALLSELHRVQPEVEELRAKLSSHQATVAAKEDLERQLSTREAELENERRVRQRLENSSATDDELRQLRTKLDQVEKALATERKECTSLKSRFANVNMLRERQEERLSSLKTKLKEAQKTATKKADIDKRNVEGTKTITGRDQPIVENRERDSALPKRQANRTKTSPENSFEDITIQTPGNARQSAKRTARNRGGENNVVGQKSNFSITPFLNKTRGISDDSLEPHSNKSSSLSVAEDGIVAESPGILSETYCDNQIESPSIQATTYNGARRRINKPQKKALAETSNSEVNRSIMRASKAMPKGGAKKRVRVCDVMGVESTDSGQENVQIKDTGKDQEEPTMPENTSEASPKVKAVDPETKTRKRKLLSVTANTMLEDDEAEATQKADMPANSAPAKRAKAPLGGGVTNAFASAGKSFSPLKRQRRGMNASFLA